jgi:putative ABC transport system substrate-binding protein
MRRREFITLLAAAAAAPPVARAQRAGIPTIGFLGPTTPQIWSSWTSAFVDRFAQLGWVDGRTVNIAYRWANGHMDRASKLATELVALKVDLIVTSGSATAEAMKATSQIPIVFALASEPLATGFVASLARPGGNVTGLSLEAPDLGGKRLGYLRHAVPEARRLAVLSDVAYLASKLDRDHITAAAPALGFETTPLDIRRAEDIEPAFARLGDHADAMYVCSADPLVNNNRDRICALALEAKLPTVYAERAYAEAGGLISYGPVVPEMFRRAAEYADKILKGARPADLPVEQPNTFELVINLKTAKALGLTIPQTLIATADQVIE